MRFKSLVFTLSPAVMFSRFLVLIFFGTFLLSCSPDPRWGPPRSGLREPMEWQYRNSNKSTSISYDEPETRRSEQAVAFVTYRPDSVPAIEFVIRESY